MQNIAIETPLIVHLLSIEICPTCPVTFVQRAQFLSGVFSQVILRRTLSCDNVHCHVTSVGGENSRGKSAGVMFLVSQSLT